MRTILNIEPYSPLKPTKFGFIFIGPNFLKGVFAKNERGYRLNAIKKALSIATYLTSICCVYKEKIVKDVSYRIT